MRNRYPGVCYRCKKVVEVGDGHFERQNGFWRTQHASCAVLARSRDGRKVLRKEQQAVEDQWNRSANE